MNDFIGIEFGSKGCKLKQIVIEEGEPVEKISPILFWVVHDIGGKSLHTPISKLDMELHTSIVPAQLFNAYNDKGRSIIRKTDKGTSVHPFGAIIT